VTAPTSPVAVRSSRTAGPPAYQVLADDLREQITSGRLRPGDRLPTEPQLCAQSGLSRSTVREALRLLSSQHLIVTTRGVTGGSFVAEPSARKIAESLEGGLGMLAASGMFAGAHLLEVRNMLEVPAAGLAALRRTQTHLDELVSALFDPAGDIDAVIDGNYRFHTALAKAAGNPLLVLVSHPLYSVAHEQRLAERSPVEFWSQVDADHRQILDAVAEGDADQASAAARLHLEHLERDLGELW
jgi:GntR family transcriptional repressor for pyruvate dehydrogenase complex